MKAKELKAWVDQIPLEGVIEGRERKWGDFMPEFELRVVFPMLTATKTEEES